MEKRIEKENAFGNSVTDGVVLWLDALSLGLKGGEKVFNWKNKASYALNKVNDAFQSDEEKAPVFTEHGIINGLPTVKMSAGNFMNIGTESGFSLEDMTIFAVINSDFNNGYHELLSRLSPYPHDHNWFFNVDNGFNFGWGYSAGAGSSYYQYRAPIECKTSYVFSASRNKNVGKSYLNGILEKTFNGVSPNSSDAPVFLGGANGDSFVGEIGEILVFDKALTKDEYDRIENYLEKKWEIKNNRKCMLKSLKVSGKEISGFSPKIFNYSVYGKDVPDISDVNAVTYDPDETIEIIKEEKRIIVKVYSKDKKNDNEYTIRFDRMRYAYNEIKDLSLDEVRINEGFWNTLISQYSDYSINYIFDMFDYTGSFDNFDRVAKGERAWLDNLSEHAGEILIPSGSNRLIGKKDGEWRWGVEPWREGLIFETICAAGNYIIENRKDRQTKDSADLLAKRIDSYISRIYSSALSTTGTDAKGKVIDGFFSTYNLLKSNSVLDEANGGAVWNHDLYNFGCLTEAGISIYNAIGDTRLLYASTRFSEFIVDYIFGTEKERGYLAVPPHSLPEEALLDLYDLYKNNPSLVKEMEESYTFAQKLDPRDRYYELHIRYEKYLEICDMWIKDRGNYERRYGGASYGIYAQDQCSHKDMTEALGHAVRANLWYSSIAAIGNYTKNKSYVESAKRIWNNIMDTQLYVTGGTGASESLGEAYAGSYVLPQDGYCETCASVGMAFYSDNMFLLFGSSEYHDLIELELYNGILGSVSLSGDAFYYCNPLVSQDYVRPNWSGATPCCPPMYMKFFALLPTYIYAKTDKALFVNQYISSSAKTKIGNTDVCVNCQTDMPTGSSAKFDIEANGFFTVKFRFPSWATDYAITVNNENVKAEKGKDGYIDVYREWKRGDSVEITFKKEVTYLRQDNVSFNRGQVALQYGPLVYCAESEDNPDFESGISGIAEGKITVTEDSAFISDLANDLFKVQVDMQKSVAIPINLLKGNVKDSESGKETILTLVPFFIRGNRKNRSMRVWMSYERTRKNRKDTCK